MLTPTLATSCASLPGAAATCGWPANTTPIKPPMLVPTQSSVLGCNCASNASMSAA
jgi:hypothetical protein